MQLLRCIQPEVKELVHAALDILVPALPFRLTAAVRTRTVYKALVRSLHTLNFSFRHTTCEAVFVVVAFFAAVTRCLRRTRVFFTF